MSAEGGLAISETSMLGTLVTMNFLHYAIFLFVVSIAVMVLVSLSTQKTAKEIEPALTYDYSQKRKWKLSKETIYSFTIIAVVLVLWWVFR